MKSEYAIIVNQWGNDAKFKNKCMDYCLSILKKNRSLTSAKTNIYNKFKIVKS